MVFTDEDITKLYRIRKTILQMLFDRNYLVDETQLTMSREDFIFKFGEHMKREQLEINTTHRNKTSEKICVFFFDDAKLGVNIVRGIINRMLKENVDNGIMVCQNKLSPAARKAVAGMSSIGSKRLEVFMVIVSVFLL